MSETTIERVELVDASHYDHDLVAVRVVRSSDDPEAFPQQLVLSRDELQQLVDAAHTQHDITPTGAATPPF
jgi:hypothetical protein